MNCAKCSQPAKRTATIKARTPAIVPLEKTGIIWQGEELFACPVCKAKFWFQKTDTIPALV